MLFNNILNTTFALAIMALDILVYVKHADKRYSLIGLIIDSALLYATFRATTHIMISKLLTNLQIIHDHTGNLRYSSLSSPCRIR